MADKRAARKAIEQHGADLRGRANVVGLGIQPADDGSGEALAVYVSRKVPASELEPDDLLPASVEISGKDGIERVPIRVIELGGELKAQ